MPSSVNNILIVSASIGSGHNQAASAVRSEVLELSPATKVSVVDFLAGDNFSLNHFVKETYMKMIDIFPDMYDLLYRWTKERDQGDTVGGLMSWILKRRMFRLVRQYRPDIIVFTHPFACGAAAYLKRAGKLKTPLAAVITDFAVHGLWIYPEVDYYFVATEQMKAELISHSIAPERIHVTGIPIHAAFRNKSGQTNRSAKDIPHILMMGGGLGMGDFDTVIRSLDELDNPFNLAVVAGRNATLRKDLRLLSSVCRRPVHVLGYTRQVPELMAEADLLITKPGALTCSEALAMELPLALINPIPGQEEENAAWLANHGAALWIQDEYDLPAVVADLLTNPEKLAHMREAARRIQRPDAATHIAKTLLSPLSRS